MKNTDPEFLKTAGRILNAGQSRTLLLTGNIHDLFRLPDSKNLPEGDEGAASLADQTGYVPLVDFLTAKWDLASKIILVYELNGPIRFLREGDHEEMRDAWLKWRTGLDADSLAIKAMLSAGKTQARIDTLSRAFDDNLSSAIGKPTVALELLRQMCLCSRSRTDAKAFLEKDLIILVEAADMVIPEGQIPSLRDADRHRVSICQDWFSDPGFTNGEDSVALIAESRALVNHRIARLPQVIEVPVPSPSEAERMEFIDWFDAALEGKKKLRLWATKKDLAKFTAGLSIHALTQLLKGASHQRKTLGLDDVIDKVEDFIQSQLGDDIVEFKKPAHSLEDVVGNTRLKEFIRAELMPRFSTSGPGALTGAAVSGPIGGGKTFIFEAVANELDMVVLVLKNIRSQWFGQTDVIFERLRRVLVALSQVLIFVDEADTQFGGVGPEAHSTERRLTGKIQAMMSDPQLRGRVFWLLMTARIHQLSPDIRRPGRAGDLILPVLDPEGADREAFLRWMIAPVHRKKLSKEHLGEVDKAVEGSSAAAFASLRSELKAKLIGKKKQLSLKEILAVLEDHLPPAIDQTRRYQTLQALANCTRRSLLPNPDSDAHERESWQSEIRALEAKGIR